MKEEIKKYNLELRLDIPDFDKINKELGEVFDKAKPKLVTIGLDHSNKNDFHKLIVIGNINNSPLFIPIEEDLTQIEYVRESLRYSIDSNEISKELNKLAVVAKNTISFIEEKPKRKRNDVIPKGFYKKKRF